MEDMLKSQEVLKENQTIPKIQTHMDGTLVCWDNDEMELVKNEGCKNMEDINKNLEQSDIEIVKENTDYVYDKVVENPISIVYGLKNSSVSEENTDSIFKKAMDNFDEITKVYEIKNSSVSEEKEDMKIYTKEEICRPSHDKRAKLRKKRKRK